MTALGIASAGADHKPRQLVEFVRGVAGACIVHVATVRRVEEAMSVDRDGKSIARHDEAHGDEVVEAMRVLVIAPQVHHEASDASADVAELARGPPRSSQWDLLCTG